MGSAQDGGAEAMLEGLAHQVAHHLARDSTAGRQPPHYFAVAAIETEQHLDRFSVPAANGEHIRAPAQIALKRDHHPIVAALASAVVARQQQLIDPHDPVGALMVDPRTSLRVELAIEQRGDPPISITGALRDDRANHGHQPFVIGSRAARPCNRGLKLLDQVRARHTQRLCHRLHLESPGPCQFERNNSFFERVSSKASFRISASSVFLPNNRSSSRTRACSCLASDSGTTCSSAPRLSSSPCSISRRQRNNRLDERQLRRATRLMLEPGSEASNTSRRFSSAVYRRRFPGCGPSITSIPSGVLVIFLNDTETT